MAPAIVAMAQRLERRSATTRRMLCLPKKLCTQLWMLDGRLLRDGLAEASASTWEEHAAELERLEAELHTINRSLRAQTLRLEEHEDPTHPVVALATERIVDLSTREAAVTDATEALKAKRPAGHHPDEIVAMLDAVSRPTPYHHDGHRRAVCRDFPRLRRVDQLRQGRPNAHARGDDHARASGRTSQRKRPPRRTVADLTT
jgi:hypothetical protein